jgi:hypothetical protein
MEDLYFGKTFEEIFEKSFHKFTKNVEEHNFTHYNSSLGMQIYSKEHLRDEMKKRRMLPYEVCEDLAFEWDKEHSENKFDKLSVKADNIIRSLKMTADSKGNLKLGGRAIEALMKIGAISTTEHRPDYLSMSGGFK